MKDFIYDNWEDAIHDCLMDGIGDSSRIIEDKYGSHEFIDEEDFDLLEKNIFMYISDLPGLHIFYFRPQQVWRRIIKLFKRRS